MSVLVRPIVAGSLGLLAPIAAGAQSARDSVRRDSVQALGRVTISQTRATSSSGGATAVEIQVPNLRSSPAPMMDQALREAPFVLVRQNSRGETEISLRGSDSRQAAVFLNGVPLTLGWDHRTDPSLIPMTGSDRLTIVRGLASVLHGPNTLGGIIDISQGPAPAGGQLRAGAGLDQTSASVLSLGGEWGGGNGWSARGGVGRRSRDGFRLPSGARDPTARDDLRTNTDLDQLDGFASLGWRNATGRSVQLALSGFRAERGVAPEEHINAPRLWRYPYSDRNMAALSATSGAIRTPLGFASVDVGVGHHDGRLKIQTFRDRTFTTVTAEELGDESALSLRALLTHSIGSATWRASATRADVRYEETLTPAAPVDYRQVLTSLATELEVPMGVRTTIAGGLATDRTHTPATGGRPSQGALSNPGWRLGMTHRLADPIRLHASASQRSRYPALRELYSGALNRFLPNPDLRPETLLGFEAGITASGSPGANVTASGQVVGFVHEMDDGVVRITLPAPDRRFRRINRDRIESSGVELMGGLTLGPVARPLTVSLDATFQNITIFDESLVSQPSRHPENNPERRGSLEVGVPLGRGFRAVGAARYTGTQYCVNPETAREMALSGATRHDYSVERDFAIAGSRWFRALRAMVALDNASNTLVYDQCGLPQPGRTLRAMVTVR